MIIEKSKDSHKNIIFTILEQTVNGALQGLGKIYIPAIALTVGVFVKFVLNLILVPIPWIGASGAAIATAVCHLVAFGIGFRILKKNMELTQLILNLYYMDIDIV